MFMIAGLGNPTKKYENTRHNIGFECIDHLAEQYHISIREEKCKALIGTGVMGGQKVMLVKPQTFMNASGDAIGALLRFYKLDPESQLLVMYDDISLAPGDLRIRKKGSAGGHNGVKSIIAQTGTQQFARIKVGVGEKPADWDLADYVLGRFGKEDREAVERAVKMASEAAALIVEGQIDAAMNQFNGKGKA
ncbi:MAG: aminoacyl-tRNA hydrolase [Lachnospiraceae bacterium]